MSTINVSHDSFTCHQVDDFAVLTILEGAGLLSTTVSGIEQLVELMNTIRDSEQINGLAVLYSDKYHGDAEYKQFLEESLKEKNVNLEGRFATTYKIALIQIIEILNTFPMPIVGGMNGDIGPDSFAANMVFDLRIATHDTIFIHPNLQLGLPPSPPLAFYLSHNLGPSKATELILTKPRFSSKEALDLGLITQVVSAQDLEKTCLDQLRQLSNIPGHAIAEARRMLQPDLDETRKHIEAGFKGSIRSLYKMQS
jgi:enoyl-CoA hydratase/carnithine racemase